MAAGLGPWGCGSFVIWFCYQVIAKPDNKTATHPWFSPSARTWMAKFMSCIPSSLSYKMRCSDYIFLLHLTLGFNILCKDNFKPRRETFKFCDMVRLILEISWYVLSNSCPAVHTIVSWPDTVYIWNWTFFGVLLKQWQLTRWSLGDVAVIFKKKYDFQTHYTE